MTGHLVITPALDALWQDLQSVASTFAGIDCTDANLGAAVGNDALRERIDHFGKDWKDRRTQIMADLDTSWQTAQKIAEAFTQVDSDLASGLRK